MNINIDEDLKRLNELLREAVEENKKESFTAHLNNPEPGNTCPQPADKN